MSTDRIHQSFGDDQQPWMTEAGCLDVNPEFMFPGRKERDARHAKAVCRTCRVRTACLTFALDEGLDWGVFGGVSEGERRKLRRATR